jgi:carboxymethylenebutenolidase
MVRRLTFQFVVLVGGMLALAVSGAAAGAPDEGKPVKFTSGNRDITAALFEPAGSGPHPAVVEIHGIYGRNHWDTEVSQRLAAEGFVTLSIDLYGREARDYDDGLHLRDQLRPHLRDDLRAAVAYLKSVSGVSADRIGALGWCMGGGFVLQLAIAEPTLRAGVIYYGPVVVDESELKQVHARLIGFFGQEDRSIPVPAIKMMANAFSDLGNPMDLHLYPNARHGFAESEKGHNPAYIPEAAEDSWQRSVSFLKSTLKP